jgi:hypothetical protein
MWVFAIRIENPNDVTVQCFHNPNARQHRVATAAAEHQDLDCRLPFRQVGFALR